MGKLKENPYVCRLQRKVKRIYRLQKREPDKMEIINQHGINKFDEGEPKGIRDAQSGTVKILNIKIMRDGKLYYTDQQGVDTEITDNRTLSEIIARIVEKNWQN